MKKVRRQSVLILVGSGILGIVFHFSLVKDFFRGEYQHSFLSAQDYPSVTFVSLEEAEAMFFRREALFVDSRSKEDYRKGHILGALNIPFEGLRREEYEALNTVSLDRVLVIYCDGSECQSSVELARVLDEKGYQNIKVFFGGWEEWFRKGLPVSSENDSQ